MPACGYAAFLRLNFCDSDKESLENMQDKRKPGFPGSLTDLHRYRKTVHGHDGSSRIVMVRKTDQRTYASIEKGQEPKLETITRETIETFRGQRTECKFTTEKKDFEDKFPADLIEALTDKAKKTTKRGVTKTKMSIADFQKECLKAHNEFRYKHGVPPLTLNKEICKISQSWADNLSKRKTLEHSNNNDYGENIFCVSSSDPNLSITGDEPVKSWYEEIKFHKFDEEPKSLESGHFTQVVWKDSRELGVAFAKSNGRIVVVANYFPSGNIVGHFVKNVPPLGRHTEENNNNDPSEKLANLSLQSRVPSCSSKKNLSNGTEGNFEEDFLVAHNEYRKRHGVSALKLDKKLCKYASEWAKNLADRNALEHRKNSPHGENIYCLSSNDPNFTITGHTPVDTWYEEIKFHPFGKEPSNLKSGHFTQVIWKSSELLGVGVAKNRHGRIYVVANYSPAGNFVGDYVENVPPLLNPSEIADFQDSLSSTENASPVTPEVTRQDSLSEFEQFALDGLKTHNEYRKKHGIPELRLNKKLCDFAQEWADHCAHHADMAHRPNNNYGENIFYAYSSDYSHVPAARDAVKAWYDEIRDHTFGTEKVNNRTLHFTQVIWRGSKELGIAMAKNSKGETYVVANYEPRGNYIGQFVDNVPRPLY